MTFITYYLLIGLLFFGSLGVEVLRRLFEIDIFSDEKPDATEVQSELRDTLCDLYDMFGLRGLNIGWAIFVIITCFVHIVLWPYLVFLTIIELVKKTL